MEKKEVKKKGYKEIIKKGRTHQAVYDEFKTTRPALNKAIAAQLADVPSASVRSKWQTWLHIYIALIGAMALLRILGVVALSQGKLAPWAILLTLFAALVLPGIGIFGALKYKLEYLKSTSIILIIFTLRGWRDTEINTPTMLVIGLVAVVVILGLYLPYKMKTPYKTAIVKKEINGKTLTDFDIQFEEQLAYHNDDLLDTEL